MSGEREISLSQAKSWGNRTVISALLAVFCLFGYRSSYSVLQPFLRDAMDWTTLQTSAGYACMMSVYAITAFFSGSLVDKKGNRPSYIIGAITCFLGYFLCSRVLPDHGGPSAVPLYLATYSLFAGIGTGMLWVSSTVSCRKWFVGSQYGTKWGIAFMGAPIAQLLMTLVVKPVLQNAGWRTGMAVMAIIIAVLLAIAAVAAAPTPDMVGLQPFGQAELEAANAGKPKKEGYKGTLGQAFKSRALWTDIINFMCATAAESLMWSQMISYLSDPSVGWESSAAYVYMLIGVFGLFTMPISGKLSDKLVVKEGNERVARRKMLIISPACGVIGGILMILGPTVVGGTAGLVITVIATIFLATYWAITPGGCAGYAGTVFGGKIFGKIWGASTLIIMGIGPMMGTFLGTGLHDAFNSFIPTYIAGTALFAGSLLMGILLPIKINIGGQDL